MRRCAILLLVLFVLVVPAAAQSGGYTPFAWAEGDLALAYPSGWDTPVTSEQNRLPALQLAQALAAAPDTRPPGIPFITLMFFPGDTTDADVAIPLQSVFQQMGLAPGVGAPTVLLGFDAVMAQATSADGSLFGLGRAARLADGRVLVIAGRAPAAQQAAFTEVFNTVADSLVLGVASEPVLPIYGVLWHTIRTLADGEAAFVNLAAIAVTSENRLYALDEVVGVIELDAATGEVLRSWHHDDMVLPSALAVDNVGTLYVADRLCQCVFTLSIDGEWSETITGFGQDAPASHAVTPDGTLYVTDQDDTGVLVRVFQEDSETPVRFDDTVLSPPLLAVNRAGRLLALTDDGRVLQLAGETFEPLAELNAAGLVVNGITVDASQQFILATTNQGVLVVSPAGEMTDSIGRIVINSPLPGDFVSPQAVAVGADGTVYVADSDGTFGAITAMSTRVQAGRIGSTALLPGVQVQGTLNAQTRQQDWTLVAAAGQRVTISAVDNGGGMLDPALRLIAPDGSEVAYNDDLDAADLPNATDAQLADIALPADGVYTVRVELRNGSGSYSLGVSREQLFELSADGVTRLTGSIRAALPVERWTFQGKVGQTLTFTMQAAGGNLDAVLRLLDANNTVIAENDDAADAALGKDAQLVQVRLPADGVYTLEARRFEGEGDYTLVIVATS
ncbi:MAG: pre-peptidase C-terminal domain-containing protein [Chloroflexi bacterium]|nr:pre-peptidase C-terminal domain-containing protein [Chloroflexota bacterium]